MSSSIPDKYRSDHLFLTVGTNPLPNWVAAKLLARPKCGFHLLVSSGTSMIARRIEDKLIRDAEPTEIPLVRTIELNDPSDARYITYTLEAYLKQLGLKSAASIGLNYTGGTKAMSVHAHEVLKAWCQEHQCNYAFSYLDSRHLSFRFADGVEISIEPSNYRLSLSELIKLHGWEITSFGDKPVLANFCRKLAKNLGGESKLDVLASWRQWCDWNLRTWSGKNAWKKADWPSFQQSGRGEALVKWVAAKREHETVLQELMMWVQGVNRKQKKRVLQWVKPHLAIPIEAETLGALLGKLEESTGWQNSNKGFDKLSELLDGTWLEDYVLDCILKVAEQCDINPRKCESEDSAEENTGEKCFEAMMGITIKRTIENYQAHFEFDVAVMRGYQLFAFSCTTSTERGLNKKKLFEVFMRARQMGGDEAHVALVGGYADAEGLLREVNEEWLAPRDMIRVFGPKDWPDLQDKMAEWFNG